MEKLEDTWTALWLASAQNLSDERRPHLQTSCDASHSGLYFVLQIRYFHLVLSLGGMIQAG